MKPMVRHRVGLALSPLAAVLLVASCEKAQVVCSPTDPLCSGGGGGAAASLTMTAGDGQSTSAGTAVVIAPAVTVRDASGNPVSGVSVAFAVASGGGTVAGSPATSNASGVATVGSWTLGATPGTNTLTATAGSLPAVTFTATGANPCQLSTPHTIGTTSNGVLATTDCALPSGAYIDFYSTTIGGANALGFIQTSTAIDTYLYVVTASGVLIAENDDFTGTNSAIKALLPAGSYRLGASSFETGAVGSYAVSSATLSAAVVNCEDVFIVRGVSTTQDVTTTDCFDGTYYGDSYWIYLQSGQAVTIRHASSAFDAYLELFDEADVLVASNDDATGNDSEIVFTASATGYYRIFASTFDAGATGSYTLSIP
jgi:hypothetical protein